MGVGGFYVLEGAGFVGEGGRGRGGIWKIYLLGEREEI